MKTEREISGDTPEEKPVSAFALLAMQQLPEAAALPSGSLRGQHCPPALSWQANSEKSAIDNRL
jgi:hypothetical protein